MRLEIVGAVQRLSTEQSQFIHPLMREWIQGGGLISPDAALGEQRFFLSDRMSRADQNGPAKSAQQRILQAHARHPQASNAQLARRTSTSRGYVGKVLRKEGLR